MVNSIQEKDQSLKELRRRLADVLATDERVVFSYLFGSRAVQLEREDSDVDIAVYYAHPLTLWETLRFQEELAEALGLPVQLINLNSKVRPRFLKNIIDHGLLIKDSPQRERWVREMETTIKVREKEIKKDIRRPLIDSLKDKAHLIRQVIPKLREVDLGKVLAGDIDEGARFIGFLMMAFEPMEAAVKKVASLVATKEKGKSPNSLKQAMEKVKKPLNLSEETVETLFALKPLSDTMAHAYWEISAEILEKFDKAVVEKALRDLQTSLAEYILEVERKL